MKHAISFKPLLMTLFVALAATACGVSVHESASTVAADKNEETPEMIALKKTIEADQLEIVRLTDIYVECVHGLDPSICSKTIKSLKSILQDPAIIASKRFESVFINADFSDLSPSGGVVVDAKASKEALAEFFQKQLTVLSAIGDAAKEFAANIPGMTVECRKFVAPKDCWRTIVILNAMPKDVFDNQEFTKINIGPKFIGRLNSKEITVDGRAESDVIRKHLLNAKKP